jgi:uncharacterized protein (UPF0261 family)
VQARTSAEEVKLIAQAVAGKLNRAGGPVRFLVPAGGWSSLSIKGMELHDPKADKVFVTELCRRLKPEIIVRELPLELNSAEFAAEVVRALDEIMQR